MEIENCLKQPPKWVFPKIVVPQNGWIIMENPIKMDDVGGTIIFGNIQISINLSNVQSQADWNQTPGNSWS